MHDFGDLVYLDLHKTGSTFVSAFLKHCCRCEETKFRKHDWIREDYNPSSFYFITIRHPLQIYSSLYRYGLSEKGDVFYRIRRLQRLDVYESYDSFLSFALDSKNALNLGFGYRQDIAEEMGLMSFRFLKLSLQYPMLQINETLRKGLKIASLQNNFITGLEIKNEHLNEGLRELSESVFPDLFDTSKANDFLNSMPKMNASNAAADEIDASISTSTYSKLKQKEDLLFSRYS